MDLGAVLSIYRGSSGEATSAMYRQLEQLGPIGLTAVNLFRAQKASERAKKYRGGIAGQGSYRSMAYDRKQWAIENLAKILQEHAGACGIRWGWGEDEKQVRHRIVLYVDLPTGQVSFHTDRRTIGPDYPGQWDGVRGASPQRVCEFVSGVLTDTWQSMVTDSSPIARHLDEQFDMMFQR